MEFVLDRISRASATRAFRATPLNHELIYDSVKLDPIVESFLYQRSEIASGLGRSLFEQLDAKGPSGGVHGDGLIGHVVLVRYEKGNRRR